MDFRIISENFNSVQKFDCGSTIWFTSDTHFKQERAFELSKRNRAFKNVDDMTLTMLTHICQIPTDDLLIHLGDVGDPNYMTALLNVHPKTILVLGNYEQKHMEKYNYTFDIYKDWLIDSVGFKGVYNNYAILDMGHGKKFVLTHDPKYFVDHVNEITPYVNLKDDEKLYCLFGHIHGRQLVKRFGLDVGVDGHQYKPLSFDDVMFYITAIENHYDESVFC